MGKSFQDQFTVIIETIQMNLSTIKGLLAQINVLDKLAADLSDEDKEVREQLMKEVEKMIATVDELINQNEKLFDSYRKVYELTSKNA